MIKKIIGVIVLLVLIAGCGEQVSQPTEIRDLEVGIVAKALFVIAPQDFQPVEYNVPKSVLENAGVEVVTASLSREATSAMGDKVTADILLDEATSDYDALVFIGGPGASVYFENEKALSLAREFSEQGKVVAAICIAPSTLANAGVLDGKQATAFPSEQGNLEAKGATYTGDSVTVDGNIITGKNPDAAREFGQGILEKLS